MTSALLKCAAFAVAVGYASSSFAVGSTKPGGAAMPPAGGAHTAQAPRTGTLAVPAAPSSGLGTPAISNGAPVNPNASGGCTVGGGPIPKC